MQMNLDPEALRRIIEDTAQSELRYCREDPRVHPRAIAEDIAGEVMRRLRDILPFDG